MPPVVTGVTARAVAAEDLTDEQYREIYDELRSKTSLRGFTDFIGSQYSFAWWGKYEAGAAKLTREARQELRRIVGLPALPPTIAEATATVDPDAAVYQVGQAAPTRVVMVGRDVSEPITLHLNGRVDVLDEPTATPAQNSHVTPVTSPQRHSARGSIVIGRPTWEKLNSARLASGQTWDEFLAPLLAEEH